jgi:glutamate--cysteine ligase catalytic subunit
LTLTAGTPFYKGKVADWDVRWNVLSDCSDDRTESELNPLSPDYISSSRFSSANYYIWNHPRNRPEYNDFKTGVRKEDLALVEKVVA